MISIRTLVDRRRHGAEYGAPSLGDTYYNKLSGVAGLTWVHGSHSYKFGGEWANNAYDDVNKSGTTGNLSFSATETGDPSTFGRASAAPDHPACPMPASCWV